MQLSDFATLAQAQAYSETTYLDVEGGWLGQYFGIVGIANTIKSAQANTTSITLVAGSNTTIGEIATYLVETATSNGEFSIDPAKKKGEFFRLILGELLTRNLLSQAQHDFVLSSHTVVSFPFLNSNQADFASAKGTITYSQAIPQISGYIKLTVSADCEAHRPKIFAVVQGINVQIGTAPEISNAREYLARVPTNHASYIVENFYGVIS